MKRKKCSCLPFIYTHFEEHNFKDGKSAPVLTYCVEYLQYQVSLSNKMLHLILSLSKTVKPWKDSGAMVHLPPSFLSLLPRRWWSVSLQVRGRGRWTTDPPLVPSGFLSSACLAFVGAEEEHWGWEGTTYCIYSDLV